MTNSIAYQQQLQYLQQLQTAQAKVSGPQSVPSVNDKNLSANDAAAQAWGLMAYLGLLANNSIGSLDPADLNSQITATINQLNALQSQITDPTTQTFVEFALNAIGNAANPNPNQYLNNFWNQGGIVPTPPPSGPLSPTYNPLSVALYWLQTNNYQLSSASPAIGFAATMLILSIPINRLDEENYGPIVDKILGPGGIGVNGFYIQQFLFDYAASLGTLEHPAYFIGSVMESASSSSNDPTFEAFCDQVYDASSYWQPPYPPGDPRYQALIAQDWSDVAQILNNF